MPEKAKKAAPAPKKATKPATKAVTKVPSKTAVKSASATKSSAPKSKAAKFDEKAIQELQSFADISKSENVRQYLQGIVAAK